ncbi:hypothetical protein NQ317_016883 [Molorchus minor]|uniref:JmjC domain-containing protein n=1 Tax=Molorchus minor TaxID=1323400 RepID=A0ABQ9IU02_9CUCU|nr:hypothetical protein NQ317_016883 [Molorchus minor]
MVGSTKEQTENYPMGSIKIVISKPIEEHEEYHLLGKLSSLNLRKMHKHYPKPHFLPNDVEFPMKEYVFMGYDDGATMHIDFINRLMWQAQLKGSKTWFLRPPPECQNVCTPLSFLAEPGDVVLLDTRVWYHGTTTTPGQFSLSIQSEYG